MVGWHHRLNGHEFEQTLGDSEGQGKPRVLQSKESDTTLVTEQQQPIVEAGSWKLQFKVPQKVGNKTNLNNEVPCEMPKKKKIRLLKGSSKERGYMYS